MQIHAPMEACPSLEEVQQQFDAWRNQPRRGRKIPQELWDAAARLCLRYSVQKVSRALRLGYNELKERARSISQRATESPFVELGSLLPATGIVVDCEDGSERRMRIQYRGSLQADVPGLLKAFGEAGPPPPDAHPPGGRGLGLFTCRGESRYHD